MSCCNRGNAIRLADGGGAAPRSNSHGPGLTPDVGASDGEGV